MKLPTLTIAYIASTALATAEQTEKKEQQIELCQIAIISKSSFQVKQLEKNARRLSGGYRPTFSYVNEGLIGAQFTQAPWRHTQKYHVTVIKDGYLYFWGLDSRELEKVASDEKEKAPKAVKGAYLNSTFKPQRIYVEAGDHFRCIGYEGCFIAQKIIKVK